jgi:bifunctional oligoribonuclease and PAP phosphatase NrnA
MPEKKPYVALPSAIDPDLADAALRLIDGAQRIVIFGHMHPDPDALGSSLGFAHALWARGKDVVVAVPDGPPPSYAQFLPGYERVVTSLTGPAFDLLIALDAGHLSRYGDLYDRYQPLLEQAHILNIDHHVTSSGCGEVNIIDPSAAATAELITLWLSQVGWEINEQSARCLLAGIITDTRSFEFDATTSRTLLVGSYLMERGAVPIDIIKPMYRLREYPVARLFGLATATLQQDISGRMTWCEITPAMWHEAGLPVGTGDDGIPSFLIDIVGAEIGICFRQIDPELVRISVRTAESYDATAITTQFGGGGHPRAGGCSIHGTLDEAKAQILNAARALLA